MKKKQTILAITVGILLLAFIPAVQAKTTKRSIEDWFVRDAGPVGMNPHILGWGDDTDLIIYPHNFRPGWDFKPIWDCSFNGYILEEEVEDGKLAVTVYLHVTDVPFKISRWFGANVIFEGMMHYTWRFNFILDLDLYFDELVYLNNDIRLGRGRKGFGFYPKDELNPSIVQYMPYFIYAFGWTWLSCEVVSVHVNGAGEGEFTQPYDGWLAGDSAKVKINMVGMEDKDFEWGHPNYYGEPYNSFWPVEFIFFH